MVETINLGNLELGHLEQIFKIYDEVLKSGRHVNESDKRKYWHLALMLDIDDVFSEIKEKNLTYLRGEGHRTGSKFTSHSKLRIKIDRSNDQVGFMGLPNLDPIQEKNPAVKKAYKEFARRVDNCIRAINFCNTSLRKGDSIDIKLNRNIAHVIGVVKEISDYFVETGTPQEKGLEYPTTKTCYSDIEEIVKL